MIDGHPMLCHAYLSVLEDSGTLAAAGLQPRHRLALDEAGYIRAAALERGLAWVEAGADGASHKLQRGFRPRAAPSARFIADFRLRTAMGDRLGRITAPGNTG
jgi:predicted N-acyltransferase